MSGDRPTQMPDVDSLVRVLLLAAVVGCGGCHSSGSFEIRREVRENYRTLSGLAQEGAAPDELTLNLEDTTPSLQVGGPDEAVNAGVRKLLERSGAGTRGHVHVTVEASPSRPSANKGTVSIEVGIDAAFAHLPKVTRIRGTLSASLNYKRGPLSENELADRIQQEAAEIVISILDKDRPADAKPPAPLPPVQSVAVGNGITCFLHEGGQVSCQFDPRGPALPIPRMDGAAEISAGGHTACARRSDNGEIRCIQSTAGIDDFFATPVCGIEGAMAIGVQDSRGCAIVKGGKVQCWEQPESAVPCAEAKPPVEIAKLTGIAELSVGPQFSCALDSEGSAHCWVPGTEDRVHAIPGTRGLRALSAVNSVCGVTKTTVACFTDGPQPDAEYELPEPATKVVIGDQRACAQLESGELVCWGSDEPPRAVEGLSDVIDIDAGISAICALTAGHQALCWGTYYRTTKPKKLQLLPGH